MKLKTSTGMQRRGTPQRGAELQVTFDSQQPPPSTSSVPETNKDGTPWWFGKSREQFTAELSDQQKRMAGTKFGQISNLSFDSFVAPDRKSAPRDVPPPPPPGCSRACV